MTVTCAGCGRRYDVRGFPFGRTLHCTCGHRVGPPRPARIPVEPGPPRFIADSMLGRLARWLRTLGYDTTHYEAIDDAELVRRAFEEGRHPLTRDRRLLRDWHIEGGLVIESDATEAQLREVVAAFDLPRPAPERLFSRCRVCNRTLEPAAAAEVADRVPPRVRGRARSYLVCIGCERIYWEGTHTRRMRSVLERVFSPG